MKTIVGLIWIVLFCGSIKAQTCKTIELNDIYTHLSAKRGLKYNIRYDDMGNIIHLGKTIFSNSTKSVFKKPLIDFFERYALYFSVLNKDEKSKLLTTKNINVNVDSFLSIDSLCDFRIGLFNNRYIAVWSKDSLDICRFSFENSFSLIFGLNIVESQQFFYETLFKHQDSCLNIPIEKYDLQLSDDKCFLIKKGENYMIKNMNSDLYFSKKDTMPVNSPFYPKETISNLFAGLINGDFILKITHNLYNYSKKEFKIPLSKFVSYCLANDCTPFVGVESFDNDIIKVTIIYRNIDFSYNHLLYVKIPISLLQNGKDIINGKLNTYIPTHNIKNLYNEKQK